MLQARMTPFPGLRPFGEEEDYLFFGREAQTNDLLELLRTQRFLAVVGTSGSGKSSVARWQAWGPIGKPSCFDPVGTRC